MRVLYIVLVSVLIASSLMASPVYMGYSGAPGRQTCASSCHGASGGTVEVVGFPPQYTPNETYVITVRKASGLPISNFNASVRFATGPNNAGEIFPGDITEVYDVTGETNGVHMTVLDQDSATFTWLAPPQGYGILRLYVGAHQGAYDGPNTTIVTASVEASLPPGPAGDPNPWNGQTGVSPLAGLSWSAGEGADFYDVYFGTDSIPPLLASWFEGIFFDPDPDMTPGATYYWRIDSRNSFQITTGEVWHFTIMNAPGQATTPLPADSATNVPVNQIIEWVTGLEATSHDIYMGLSADSLVFVSNETEQHYEPPQSLLYGTTYFWRVDERNDAGVTPGVVWRFTTEPVNSASQPGGTLPEAYSLGPAYPNPFNATVTVPFALPQAGTIHLAIYDVLGREIALLANGNFGAGIHSVSWTSEHVGSGLYFVKLVTPAGAFTQKLIALK